MRIKNVLVLLRGTIGQSHLRAIEVERYFQKVTKHL